MDHLADRDRRLRRAGVLFAVGSAIHILDHLRRGQGSVNDVIYWAGTVAMVPQIVTATLILTRHRLAPLVAAAAGFPLALGFAATHWLPGMGPLGDPLWRIESLPALSYVASILEVAGALAIGITGAAIVRARGLETFAVGRSAPPAVRSTR